ncbi:hypothetical protein P691DRAFT_778449 [Macrolepiota fuliginosa MF-IS2]|uniref:Uncharacterized protein n=1 Tax=Macrolepiota fuliginosa MF-IS2 TaxID=1400762 RepID=A0A9P5X4C0_9AGAR|nr:hypothetical protein P691DRAFT_778449 [Macrolepiota fuliginosa MF-IS2]
MSSNHYFQNAQAFIISGGTWGPTMSSGIDTTTTNHILKDITTPQQSGGAPNPSPAVPTDSNQSKGTPPSQSSLVTAVLSLLDLISSSKL